MINRKPVFQFRFLLAVIILGLGLAFTGCSKQHPRPNYIYMPDMVYTPGFKAQKEGAMLLPVEGTVPRGFEPFAYKFDPEGAGRNLTNPLPNDEATLARGKLMFNTYCIVCHGPNAEGDGYVIPKFKQPPTLHSPKVVKEWTDGRIYHVITMGQGLMPSYASQILPKDRWAIIKYVRSLQAGGPKGISIPVDPAAQPSAGSAPAAK